jgi:hypothetical protein
VFQLDAPTLYHLDFLLQHLERHDLVNNNDQTIYPCPNWL